MTLPVKPLRRDTVTIEGIKIEVRGLSRSEAMKLTTQFTPETADDAEVFVVMAGCGVTEEEAKAFRDSNDVETVGLIVDKIIELSALSKDGTDPK